MNDDDLDSMLGADEIVPSSGFVASVMEAVRREDSTPPIPFPWRRAAPAVSAGTIALASLFVIALVQLGGSGAVVARPMPRPLVTMVEEANAAGVGWITLALLVAFASMTLAHSGRLSRAIDRRQRGRA